MVELVPMTEREFEMYLAENIQHYADEHVKAGNWHPAEALEKAKQEHEQLLTDGLASKNQYPYSIVDENLGSRIGIVWFATYPERPRPMAFLYDFLIFDEFRQKGYGAQAMAALEEKVRALGIETISLHVFGHNEIAQALYKKMGYRITGIHMTKEIKPPTQ